MSLCLGPGAVGVEKFGHGIEFHILAKEDKARIEVRRDKPAFGVRQFLGLADINRVEVRPGGARMEPAGGVARDLSVRGAGIGLDGLVHDLQNVLPGVGHLQFQRGQLLFRGRTCSGAGCVGRGAGLPGVNGWLNETSPRSNKSPKGK